jgi:hypothetical protein
MSSHTQVKAAVGPEGWVPETPARKAHRRFTRRLVMGAGLGLVAAGSLYLTYRILAARGDDSGSGGSISAPHAAAGEGSRGSGSSGNANRGADGDVSGLGTSLASLFKGSTAAAATSSEFANAAGSPSGGVTATLSLPSDVMPAASSSSNGSGVSGGGLDGGWPLQGDGAWPNPWTWDAFIYWFTSLFMQPESEGDNAAAQGSDGGVTRGGSRAIKAHSVSEPAGAARWPVLGPASASGCSGGLLSGPGLDLWERVVGAGRRRGGALSADGLPTGLLAFTSLGGALALRGALWPKRRHQRS